VVNEQIVSGLASVCLVGGVATSPSLISGINQQVDGMIAVDGGADSMLEAGLTPLAVIGDLDSLSDTARKAFDAQLWHITEQSSTDFEKALTRTDANQVIAIGFSGGRIDHQLSVLSVMRRHADRRVFLVDEHDVSLFVPAGVFTINLVQDARISIMPVTPAKASVSGVTWAFEDQEMAMDGFTSPSNAALGGEVVVTVNAPVLLTLARTSLPFALKAAFHAQ
jgi:thiamine pyrophosphokinase